VVAAGAEDPLLLAGAGVLLLLAGVEDPPQALRISIIAASITAKTFLAFIKDFLLLQNDFVSLKFRFFNSKSIRKT